MKLESASPNLTFYWSDEENFELHKALLFGTSSRSHKKPEDRKQFYEGKGLTTKADSFFTENLGFGDRSIAEQFNLNFEYNDVPATFSFEFLDFPFMSPIESSTRYLRIPEGYFYKFEHLQHMAGYDKYLENCDFSLDIYNRAFDELVAFYKEKFPVENIEWGQEMSNDDVTRAYNSTIKSKSADAVKIFLPFSVNTNFTVCMNARALQDLIGRLVYYNIMNEGFIKPLLDPLIKYVSENSQTKSLFSKLPEVINIWSKRAENTELRPKVTADVELWGESGLVNAYNMTEDVVPIIPNRMPRVNRHDRIDDNYSLNMFVFEVISSIGAYRDLNRHRHAQTHAMGINNPIILIPNKDMKENFLNYLGEYQKDNVLDEIPKKESRPLFYAGCPLGASIKWHMYTNLFELSNIVELRTTKGGYWEYIQIARDLAKSVGMQYNLFEHADFVTDYNNTLPTLRQEMKKVIA